MSYEASRRRTHLVRFAKIGATLMVALLAAKIFSMLFIDLQG
jgi:hypothetical protein